MRTSLETELRLSSGVGGAVCERPPTGWSGSCVEAGAQREGRGEAVVGQKGIAHSLDDALVDCGLFFVEGRLDEVGVRQRARVAHLCSTVHVIEKSGQAEGFEGEGWRQWR